MKVKEKSENGSLRLNVPKMKTMVPSPITSWQLDEEKMEPMRDYFFGP